MVFLYKYLVINSFNFILFDCMYFFWGFDECNVLKVIFMK